MKEARKRAQSARQARSRAAQARPHVASVVLEPTLPTAPRRAPSVPPALKTTTASPAPCASLAPVAAMPRQARTLATTRLAASYARPDTTTMTVAQNQRAWRAGLATTHLVTRPSVSSVRRAGMTTTLTINRRPRRRASNAKLVSLHQQDQSSASIARRGTTIMTKIRLPHATTTTASARLARSQRWDQTSVSRVQQARTTTTRHRARLAECAPQGHTLAVGRPRVLSAMLAKLTWTSIQIQAARVAVLDSIVVPGLQFAHLVLLVEATMIGSRTQNAKSA